MSEKSSSEQSDEDELESRRYVVVGLGGIGSWLSEGLCRIAEYRNPGSVVLLVDGDNFEPKNVERQSTPEVSGNKAEVVANHLVPKFQNTFVIPLAAWVVADDSEVEVEGEDEENGITKVRASDLLEEGDVVYAVVDNFKARADIVNAASRMDNVDVFLGGNGDDLSGDIYHYRRVDGEDVTRNPTERSADLQNPPDRNPGEMSCQERAEVEGGTQLIATNLTVAALLLARTQHTIIEQQDINVSQIYFDMDPGIARPYDRRVVEANSENKELAQSK